MKKKITSSFIIALMIAGITSSSAFATTANGSVVIGDKTFDLAYANDVRNSKEITNAIIEGGAIYVKDFSGNWIDNTTGKIVDASVMPGQGDELTVAQAMNILKTHKGVSNDFNYAEDLYYYTPDDNYLSPTIYSNYKEIKNNYYIFSYADPDGSEADSNLCVNKKTGEIYVIDPSGIFMTLDQKDMRYINSLNPSD
ncbi:hypothetical protein K2F43_14880 [Clostridium estertheticum]|uniref:hypothetical protein n=1 Tax=Clostridium estertheticum TaxID=238834 RepID=UPI001C6E75A7|nr:hypothetical protein [Clostridium estertheticum]MBW9172492.1 hypothetical protein [Clostridium estertheticum]WLC76549.1 hypothetical protein KTC99_07040 [Clostridium estertheticum]